MKKILVLCNGNSCRSQMAEAYLNFYGERQFKVVSAGFSKAQNVHQLAIAAMLEDGIDITNHNTKGITEIDKEKFDYIISVCGPKDYDLLSPALTKRYTKYIEWVVEDPTLVEVEETEKMDFFRETAEYIKTLVLKFIGQEALVRFPSMAAA